MACDQRDIIASVYNDADFRSFVKTIKDQVIACGGTLTADPQIDETTVTRPASGVWSTDYLFFSTPGTEKLYCQIMFGHGATTNTPMLALGSGDGTTGAGALTGVVCGPWQASTAYNKTSGVTLPSLMSMGRGWVHICTRLDNADYNFALLAAVERTMRDLSTPTGDGKWGFGHGGATGMSWRTVPAVGTPPGNSSNKGPWVDPGYGVAPVVGAKAAMWMGSILCGRHFNVTNLACYRHADFGELGPVTYKVAGPSGDEDHTYMPLGDGLSYPGAIVPVNCSLALRWE